MTGLLLVLAAWAAAAPVKEPAADPDLLSWLENGSSPMVEWWSADADSKAADFLGALPGRERLRQRLGELMRAGSIEGIEVRGERLFVLRRSSGDLQPKLFVHDPGEETPLLALDVDAISPDGTWALDWWSPSLDGALLAYGLTDLRVGESVVRVRDVDSAVDLPDRIPRAPAAGAAWLADRTGFFYGRLPKPGSVPEAELDYHRRIYFHLLGTDPLDDPLVFGGGRPKEEWPEARMSPDGRYLLVTVRQGSRRSELYVSDLRAKSTDFVTIVAGADALFEGKFGGDTLYILTNEDAPRGRIAATDFRKPFKVLGLRPKARAWKRPNWREVVPEGPLAIAGFEPVEGGVVVHSLERGISRLSVYDLEGTGLREIALPGSGSVRALAGRPRSDAFYVVHESFFAPTALLRCAAGGSAASVVSAVAPSWRPGAFEAREESFLDRDGKAVTVWLASRKGLRRDRNAPAMVLAPGAGAAAPVPFFAPHLAAWFEKGGLLAVPVSEKAVDLEDAARWLVAKEFTRPERLAAVGTGLGGLAAGWAAVRAPEVFRAAALSSPWTDLLGLGRMSPGARWVRDYDVRGPDGLPLRLAEMSPLHQVEQGVPYPAFLISAGTWDQEVHPSQSRKLAARLQACTSSGKPVLLRVRARAGRERGRPLDVVLDELADRYAFLLRELGVQ
ncbi:MAG: prolyl oligopeptidase family serine peptidase [Elusimicrobia bacterium]|nr:prolyl oligopeptidase family serine peptidase [Elusimicrobiota bacterium]